VPDCYFDCLCTTAGSLSKVLTDSAVQLKLEKALEQNVQACLVNVGLSYVGSHLPPHVLTYITAHVMECIGVFTDPTRLQQCGVSGGSSLQSVLQGVGG
jgi:hypothetical protein